MLYYFNSTRAWKYLHSISRGGRGDKSIAKTGAINPKNSGQNTRGRVKRREKGISVTEKSVPLCWTRKAREESISKAHPGFHANICQTSVFKMRKYFLSDCILSVKLLFEARDEDVVKKNELFLVSRTKHRLSALLATRIFHTHNFLLLLLRILRSRHVFWEYLLFTCC